MSSRYQFSIFSISSLFPNKYCNKILFSERLIHQHPQVLGAASADADE